MRATTRPLGLKQGDVAGESEVLWLDNSLELNDGKEYEYVYDPFGRLRKIKNTSNQALVAEYWYNGLGHRITWHSDTSRSGGGAPDGTVDTNDPKVHFIYNERWQQVATYRQANGSSIDTHPKEQFVNHAAGLAGYGSSSYIDGVILRDDHEDDWTEAADSTMERRVYYCQNWRADVVALLSENGRVLERAWYEPYGTPHGVSPADFSGTSDDTNDHYLVPDGDADADDSFVYLDLFGLSAGLSDTTGSSDPGDPEYGRPNGTVDSDDYFYYLDQYSVAAVLGRNVLSSGHDGATASHGAGNLRNRKGLAGYEWDPHVRRYHVRNRVLYPEIGRWTRRDPLGYVDGVGLLSYLPVSPMIGVDGTGEAMTYANYNCTQAQFSDILSAARRVRTAVTNAQIELAGITNADIATMCPGDPPGGGNAYVDREWRQGMKRLRHIVNAMNLRLLGIDPPNTTLRVYCDAQCDPGVDAYVPCNLLFGCSHEVHFCPPFFGLGAAMQTEILFHEMTHAFHDTVDNPDPNDPSDLANSAHDLDGLVSPGGVKGFIKGLCNSISVNKPKKGGGAGQGSLIARAWQRRPSFRTSPPHWGATPIVLPMPSESSMIPLDADTSLAAG